EYPSVTTVTGKTILAPITNFIEPRIGIVDDNSPVSVLTKEFKIEKIRRITRPGNNIGAVAATAAVPNIPDVQVDAWAEVQNTAISNWNISGVGLATQTSLYGPDTGPGTNTPYTLANGTVVDPGYYIGTPNGITNFYDDTVGAVNPSNSYADGSYNSDGFVGAITTGQGGDNGFLKQDVSTHFTDANGASCGFIMDNWYEVKLSGITGNPQLTDIGGIYYFAKILIENVLDSSTFPTGYGSGDILPGHTGIVGTGTGNHAIAFEDKGNGVYIARWQHKNSNLNELSVLFFNFTGTVDKIELFDITEKEFGVALSAWSIGPGYWIPPWNKTGTSEHVQIYHGRSPRRTVYCLDNKVFWGNDINDPINSTGRRGAHVAQSFSLLSTSGA
ncbi:MAG TPA: hypothetical protein DEG69_09080, partial [Flavobacteriaceae bacterium]|nr:hypothetical protein [Flavobacteriaceae bacterium]